MMTDQLVMYLGYRQTTVTQVTGRTMRGTLPLVLPICGKLLAAALLTVAVMTASVQAAGRAALVLDAEDYPGSVKSEGGVEKGRAIADALRSLGFEVSIGTNSTNSQARAALGTFASKTEGADMALAIILGHGVSSGGQTFFLPTNSVIERPTDLLSRGLSITNIAQISGRAKLGAVCFLMTTPDFSAPITGLDARPQFDGDIAKSVAVMFSSSSKIPVSGIDAASKHAAAELVEILTKPHPTLRQLAAACRNGEVGAIFGTMTDGDLAAPPPPAPVAAAPAPDPELAKKLEAERQARKDAEKHAQEEREDAQRRQKELQDELSKQEELLAKKEKQSAEDAQKLQKALQAEIAKKEELLAKKDAQTQEEVRRQSALEQELVQKDQETKRLLEEKRLQDQRLANAASPQGQTPVAPPAPSSTQADLALVTLEVLLDPDRVRHIQMRLQRMTFYTGPIDAIIGPLTRDAIKLYQRSTSAPDTGYLNPEQLRALTSGG